MKITKKRFKQILSEEMASFKENAKHEYEKFGRSADKNAKAISKTTRSAKLHPQHEGVDDYHDDDWLDVLGPESPDEDSGEPPLPGRTSSAEELADKIYDLANEIDEYGQYDTEFQTEAYRQLFGAMEMSGVDLRMLIATLTESKK